MRQDPAPEFTEERLLAAFSAYLSGEEMQQLRRMAIDGVEVALPEKLSGCALLQSETQSVVDLGLDEGASLAAKRVTGVVQDGPAYRAGIRDGQELFRWSVYHDDPSKDALMGVVIDGQRRIISFSPRKQVHIDQYRADISGEAARNCSPF